MRTYQQTRDQLFDLQKYAIKLGLENIRLLTDLLDQPQKAYPVIHVAGTNGKGSTAFYLTLILRSCGLKVGLFTSPHLKDYRERIRVNDKLIDEKFIINFWQRVHKDVEKLKATFFDTTALMALDWFRERNVDVAVVETGLGGRLDSTNIIGPEIAVITPIGFDHQKQLGNTLDSIAAEKAGIIKPGVSVCLAAQKPEVKKVILDIAVSNQLYYLPDLYQIEIIKSGKKGIDFKLRPGTHNTFGGTEETFVVPTMADYQTENFALAWLTANLYFQQHQGDFNRALLNKYLASKSWPGRLQVVSETPLIIHDVSHNLHGISRTIRDLEKHYELKNWTLLLGMVNDKDVGNIVNFLTGKFGKVIVCEPQTIRKQDGALIANLFEANGQKAIFIKDLRQAYEISKESVKTDSGLLVMGSHYLIGAL